MTGRTIRLEFWESQFFTIFLFFFYKFGIHYAQGTLRFSFRDESRLRSCVYKADILPKILRNVIKYLGGSLWKRQLGWFSLETFAMMIYPIHPQHGRTEMAPAQPRQACFLFRWSHICFTDRGNALFRPSKVLPQITCWKSKLSRHFVPNKCPKQCPTTPIRHCGQKLISPTSYWECFGLKS